MRICRGASAPGGDLEVFRNSLTSSGSALPISRRCKHRFSRHSSFWCLLPPSVRTIGRPLGHRRAFVKGESGEMGLQRNGRRSRSGQTSSLFAKDFHKDRRKAQSYRPLEEIDPAHRRRPSLPIFLSQGKGHVEIQDVHLNV